MNKCPKLISLLVGGIILGNSLFGIYVDDGVFDVDEHPNLFSGYTGYGSCTGCHQDDFQSHVTEIMASKHWTWEGTDSYTGNDIGKINMVNNYCVAVPSNEPRCTSCHIGIGWSDDTFDKTNEAAIDCLVCHDGTGTYQKNPTGAGAPLNGDTLDYQAIMRSFQTPDRDNCGACHFFGGGGDAVKHGTLDSTMSTPSDAVDVHMGPTKDMTCVDCHVADKDNAPHVIRGTRYSQPQNDAALCQECHTEAPHGGFMDVHAQKIACQTCHIPAFARGGKATKMFWDWSTAGDRIDNGDGTFSDRVITDADGNVIYHSKKGTFIWEENVVPEYTWFNGNVTHATLDTPVIDGQILKINELHGAMGDGKIFPIKRFVGIQPFDDGTDKLAVPHLFPTAGEKAGTDPKMAYWMKYDWDLALEAGQAAVDRTYVGPVVWVTSEFSWISNHMVAPASDAVQCWECHNPYGRLDFEALGYEESRVASLTSIKADEVWRGYPIEDGYVDTGDWMGVLHVAASPWVYSFDMGKFVYIPENVDLNGFWMYSMK